MRRATFAFLVLLPVLAFGQDSATPDWASHFDPFLYRQLLGYQYWQILALLALYAGSSLISWIARRTMGRLMRSWSGDTRALRGVRRSLGILIGLVLWYMALPELALGESAEREVRYAVEGVTIVAAAWWLIAMWDSLSDRVAERAGRVDRRAEKLLVPVIGNLVRAAIAILALLAALGVFGVNVAGLLAGIGIGGLVIALAAKDSVENVLGSLSLLFDMPFAIGDYVKIGAIEGTIEELNLRSTRIRAPDDTLITLPNANFVKTAVENMSERRVRRQRFHVRLKNDTTPEKLELFLARLRADVPKSVPLVPDRTVIELNEVSAGTLDILVQCFFEVATYDEETRRRNDLMLEILRVARTAGVELSTLQPVAIATT